MRRYLAVVLVAACCVLTNAQDFNHYKTLLPQGLVPKDFTELSASKFATEVTNMSAAKNKRDRKNKKKFYLESTFSLDEFLTSGNVLFNDDITLYIADVLAEILKPYPELQGKIRVYTVKSAIPNAFTTNNGIIFVNLGLLARLESEAQLAFVLAHEVVHYQKKHVINRYVTNIDIDRSKGYKKLSREAKMFAKSSFSKELEMEADLEGAEIYNKSVYNKDSIQNVFNVLKYADLPLSWVYFNKRYYESGKYIFPDTLVVRKVDPIQAVEDYNDTLYSHPNIRKRREAIAVKFHNAKGGKHFRLAKTIFDKNRKLARFELCRLYLLEHRHIDAILLATSLQEEDPKSAYLKQTVAKALYGLSKDVLNDHFEFKKQEWSGDPQRLGIFFERQSPYEISVLAIRHLYKCLEEEPENREIAVMLNDAIRSFAKEEYDLEKKFLRNASDKEIADLRYPYTQHAFTGFKNNAAFFEIFDKQLALAKKDSDGNSFRKKKKRKEKKLLNVDKVVVVNPMYKKIDTRKRQKMRHIESEEVLTQIDQKIWDAAGRLNMKADIINPNNLSSARVNVMQSNSILNDWIDEQMRFEDAHVSPIYNEIIALADTYKTDHFVWMGEFTMTRKRRGKFFLVAGSVITPAIAPLLGTMAFTPKGSTLYFALAFNVRTQALELVDVRAMKMRDTHSLLQSNIYYTLFQLKKVKQ